MSGSTEKLTPEQIELETSLRKWVDETDASFDPVHMVEWSELKTLFQHIDALQAENERLRLEKIRLTRSLGASLDDKQYRCVTCGQLFESRADILAHFSAKPSEASPVPTEEESSR